MAKVPGVGKKTASRLIMELSDVFAKDAILSMLTAEPAPAASAAAQEDASVDADAYEALLSMGFTSQEANLALEGHVQAGALTTEAALSYALKRMGGRG